MFYIKSTTIPTEKGRMEVLAAAYALYNAIVAEKRYWLH